MGEGEYHHFVQAALDHPDDWGRLLRRAVLQYDESWPLRFPIPYTCAQCRQCRCIEFQRERGDMPGQVRHVCTFCGARRHESIGTKPIASEPGCPLCGHHLADIDRFGYDVRHGGCSRSVSATHYSFPTASPSR